MKKDELRKLLKQKGLSTKGDKDDLLNRLSVYVQAALAKGKSGNSDNPNNDIINNTNNTNNDIINNTNNTNNDNTNNDNTNNDNTNNENTNNDNTTNDNTSSNSYVTNYNTATSNDDGNILKEVVMTTSNDTSNTFINDTNNITTTTTTTTTTNTDKKIDLERLLREKLKAKTKLLKQAKQTVRIDNLQGPFSLKELHDFLHNELSCNISDDNIMLNTSISSSISCILTFDNENDAVNVINIINNGSKTFPSSSSLYLTVNLNKESKQETLKITTFRPQLLYEESSRKKKKV